MANIENSMRKRQQIDTSKRTMFAFVAGAAFILGVALVVSIFLIQQIVFHTRVVVAKQQTISTLEKNVSTAQDLKDNLRALETNQALLSVRKKESASALQSVLDALPAEPNADALGASLQTNFIGAVDGLTLESLVVGDQTEGESAEADSLRFNVSVSGSITSFKELLARFERSIRVVKINKLEIHASGTKLTMNIQGEVPYEPAQRIKLGTKVIKP